MRLASNMFTGPSALKFLKQEFKGNEPMIRRIYDMPSTPLATLAAMVSGYRIVELNQHETFKNHHQTLFIGNVRSPIHYLRSWHKNSPPCLPVTVESYKRSSIYLIKPADLQQLKENPEEILKDCFIEAVSRVDRVEKQDIKRLVDRHGDCEAVLQMIDEAFPGEELASVLSRLNGK